MSSMFPWVDVNYKHGVPLPPDYEGMVLTLWERRWHGFARFSLDYRTPKFQERTIEVVPIKSGWWRPPQGWRWQQVGVPHDRQRRKLTSLAEALREPGATLSTYSGWGYF